MIDQEVKAYICYDVPEHCGHEVIDRIFLDKPSAQKYCDDVNRAWVKTSMSYWNGSTLILDIKTKIFKNGILDYHGDCDICGYDCKCNPNKLWKTEEMYREYWRPERVYHNKNHSDDIIDPDCLFCKEVDKYW